MGIKSKLLIIIILVLSNSANAALIERLGGLAYYDDVAKLTWLADANYAGAKMNWSDAMTWSATLEINGIGDWRLPDTLLTDTSCVIQGDEEIPFGYSCTGSEMGNLFYNVLGNSAGSLTNAGPFSNIQSDSYWSATLDYPYSTSSAWLFGMQHGYQGVNATINNHSAWAVHDGDVSAVPIPAAVWLFGSGLIGLIGIARRKKA